jgi:hypothetical protein
MLKKYLYLSIYSFIIVSCANNDKRYFDGEIEIVNYPKDLVQLQGDRLILNDVYNGHLSVFDSIIFISSGGQSGYFFKVFNVSGDLIGDYVMRGNGPNEFLMLSMAKNFYLEDNQLKCQIHDPNFGKVAQWNITASMDSGQSCIESLHIFNLSTYETAVFNIVERINEDKTFARAMSVETEDDNYYRLPLYIIKDSIGESVFKPFLRTPPYSKNYIISPETYFVTQDVISWDGGTLASAMLWMGQINFINLRDGEIKGVRLRDGIDFSYLESQNTLKFCYLSVDADKENIYALWSGNEFSPMEGKIDQFGDEIHVFDWRGKFVKRLKLDHPAQEIAYDPVNNILYANHIDNEEIYKYKL